MPERSLIAVCNILFKGVYTNKPIGALETQLYVTSFSRVFTPGLSQQLDSEKDDTSGVIKSSKQGCTATPMI